MKEYFIKDSITNQELINHYGFHEVPHINGKYNLEYKDKDGYGLQIWWANRHIQLILGSHSEYGIAPIPEILLRLYKDNIIKEGCDDQDASEQK